jgi:hypothetical protein
MKITQNEIDKFWSNVDKTNSCWNYTGCKDRDGYGIFTGIAKQYRAHRYSAKQAGIDIKGKVVCHKCDNRACVNPEHLFVGTQQDNLKDMVSKGRHWHNRPRKKGIYKLTPENMKEIKNSNLPAVELANKFGVHKTSIYRVKRA